MTDEKQKTRRSPLSKWIVLPIVSVLAAAALIPLLLRAPLAQKGSSEEGNAEVQERVPAVHSAQDAIDVLSGISMDLGYENALSELTEVHSATVAGDSYYRLQQNYQGIPVYGRTIVYATDETGAQISVTQNIQDVPGGLNPVPTVDPSAMQYCLLEYLAGVYPDSHWAQAFASDDLTVLPEIPRDPESLCIYTLDGSAHLAYEVFLEGLCILFDAHTGQVLLVSSPVRSATASFGFSDDTLEVPQLPSGEYVLKDEENSIYIYSAQGNTYWDPATGALDYSTLTPLLSPDPQFGERLSDSDRDDNVDYQTMMHAKESLFCVRDVSQHFTALTNHPSFEKMVLICDDDLDSIMGKNAGGWYATAEDVTGSALFDSSNPQEYVASIILGKYYSGNPYQYIDIVAHEYTHCVTRQYVNWADNSRNNEALNEAFSDIFGELVQASYTSEDPDWENASRPIYNPSKSDYPEKLGDRIPSTTDYAHGASTVISHAAYKMWTGLEGNPNSALTVQELSQLWYRAMLMMPADADFVVCRYVVETAADTIGLNDDQKQCIRQAFDEAGIESVSDAADVDFQVCEVFTTDIWDADNGRCTDCQVIIRRAGAAYGPSLPIDAPIVWNSSDSEQCHMKLDPGFYTLTLKVHGIPETEDTYTIQVMPDGSGQKVINLYVNQGKSLLDVAVRYKSGEEEYPLPGAWIEVYPKTTYGNGPVFVGEVSEQGLRLYLTPDEYTIVASAAGCIPSQITLDVQDTARRYTHVLLPEASPETVSTQLPSAPETITGGAPYDILTWEKIGTGQTDGINWTNRYAYNYVVLRGNDPAYEAINRDLYRLAAERMDSVRDEDLYQPSTDHQGIVEYYNAEYTDPRVLHNGNGIISILIHPHQAVTYSLYNGAPLGLHMLAGDYGAEYLQRIQHAVRQAHVTDVGALTLDNYAFVIIDGEIVILGVGSPGRTTFSSFARMVHTGLYVSTESTDRLRGTLRATGGTGSAAYDMQEWDRSFMRLGAPACLQVMEYTCYYPILSGTAACGQINQEIYALAEQFMTGIPDDITWTSDRFEYEVICNLSYDYHYAKDRGVCYNNNGILSYVMDWNVSLCYYKNGQSPIGREWYQGQHCIVYDLETGQHLTLAQITGMDDQTLLRMLKDAYGRIYNYYYFSMLNIDYDPTTFSLENPRFLVDREGQIILLFSCTEAYDPAILEVYPRMAHIYDLQLPTGLYLLGS